MPQRPAPSRINYQLILSVSAIFLSLCGLVVSFRQMQLSREQQRASVWPRLYVTSTVLDLNFGISIINQGVGPAIIETVAVQYQGKKYATLSTLLLGSVRSVKPFEGGFYAGDLEPNAVVRAGEEFSLFKLARNNEPLSYKLMKIVTDSSFHYRVRYADVYGNCWQYDQDHTVSLGQCADIQ